MSIGRILLIPLIISSAIVALALFNLGSDSGDSEGTDDATALVKPAKEAPKPTAAAPPTPASSGDLPVENDLIDDAQIEREQIAEAMAHLASQNQEERVEAVEQLGAYPSPDTEATLGQLLAADSNPEVRNAAALSLGSLDAPTESSLSILLSALDDQSEDVRFSALSTLEDFMLAQDENSPTYDRIRSALQTKVGASGVPEELRDSINEVLRDPNAQIAPEPVPGN